MGGGMRLRNKKNGEIKPIVEVVIENLKKNGSTLNAISIDEIKEEWENYEEPKEFYYIDADGYIKSQSVDDKDFNNIKDGVENLIEIGNYFETEEEAEKAVEKLKAWKRLKDFGCGFILDDHFTVKFVGPDATKIKSAEEQRSLSDAYKLLFGGEE